MRVTSLIALTIFLFGGNSYSSELSQPSKEKRPKTETLCVSKGGEWVFFPMGNFNICALETKDSAQFCTDNNECQGNCLPIDESVKSGTKTSGQCSANFSMPGGCPVYLIQGKVVREPCI